MRNILIITAALTLGTAAGSAQTSNAVRLQIQPGSEVSFTGTSSLHGFTCKTTQFDAQLSVDPEYATNLAELARPIGAVNVTIPVRSLNCGNKGLESNMLKAMKADQNATITFRLDTYEIDAASRTAEAFTAQATGSLKIAGRERPIQLQVRGERYPDGAVRARGERDLLMSEFGIRPPSMMLGAVKTGDRVVVRFDLQARPRLAGGN
jgi:polyisoprenoid-binding protein YceI